jgi:hypothetical protein
MADLVRVSDIEKKEKLRSYLEELFKKGKYAEITQAIGMYSILIDPEHTISDQSGLYHFVLDMIKERVRTTKGKGYAAWYTGFPKILDQIVAANQIVTDKAAAEVLASQRAALGPFKSLDDFFFWVLDDRRLPLEQIVKYIEQTALAAC